MFSRKNLRTTLVLAAAVTPVVAGLTVTRANLPTGSGPFTNSASQTIISLSGSSALKGFFGSANAYYLEPPSSGSGNNTLAFGGTTYTANSTTGSILLAPVTQGGGAQAQSESLNEGAGLEVQYLVTGSVEGIQGLVTSQLNSAYLDSPAGSGNGYTNFGLNSSYYCYVNGSANNFTAPGSSNSYTMANQGSDTIGATTNSQSAVQIAVSDVLAKQAFSYSGNGTYTPSIFATPTTPGYGKGNPTRTVNPLVLTATTTVIAGGASQLHDQTDIGATAGAGNISNLTNTAICAGASLIAANPGTGLTQVNKADAQFLQAASRLQNGLGFNVTTRDVGSGTRNTIANNTGIDPSWAVGSNDNGNGNALSVKNQFSIGEVNGNASNGPLGGIKFSNKTSGGSQLLPTIENARMCVGTISQSDASAADCDSSNNGDNTANALSATPVRALSYDNGSGPVAVSANNILTGAYAIWQQEQFVTANGGNQSVGAPIVGDDANHDAANYIKMITTSAGQYPNIGTYATPADGLVAQKWIPMQFMEVTKTVDGGNVTSVTPTGNVTAFLASSKNNLFNVATPSNLTSGATAYYGGANAAGVAGTPNYATGNFTEGKIAITAENSSGTIISGAAATQAAATGGNWLFGNFNQNGIRDLSAVLAAGQALLDGSTAFGGNGILSVNTGALNGNASTAYTNAKLNAMNAGTGATKGDLIVMGDFNGTGQFDGASLYAMATQVAASDPSVGTNGNATNYTAGTIGGSAANFGVNVENAVLRKNTALDSFKTTFAGNSTTNTNIRMAADLSKPYINSTEAGNSSNNYSNAFNKFDVLGNGYYSTAEKLANAAAVDAAVGMSYGNLSQSVTTTVTVSAAAVNQGSGNLTVPVSLTAAKLIDATDAGNTTITRADFNLIANDLGYYNPTTNPTGKLIKGDSNFDGSVNSSDLYTVIQYFGGNTSRWGQGNFEYVAGNASTYIVGAADLYDVIQNYGGIIPSGLIINTTNPDVLGDAQVMAALNADGIQIDVHPAVPEPGTLSLLTLGAVGVLSRRRRRRN